MICAKCLQPVVEREDGWFHPVEGDHLAEPHWQAEAERLRGQLQLYWYEENQRLIREVEGLRAQLEACAAEEREACARIADMVSEGLTGSIGGIVAAHGFSIAAAIRARGGQ